MNAVYDILVIVVVALVATRGCSFVLYVVTVVVSDVIVVRTAS